MGSKDCFAEDIYERLQEAADDSINQDFNVFEDEYQLDEFADKEWSCYRCKTNRKLFQIEDPLIWYFEYCDVISRDRKFFRFDF